MKKIFVIFDEKAGVHLTPFFCENVGVAMRLLTATANDKSSLLGQFAGDYSVHQVGTFDESTGLVEAFAAKTFAFRLADLVQPMMEVNHGQKAVGH